MTASILRTNIAAVLMASRLWIRDRNEGNFAYGEGKAHVISIKDNKINRIYKYYIND